MMAVGKWKRSWRKFTFVFTERDTYLAVAIILLSFCTIVTNNKVAGWILFVLSITATIGIVFSAIRVNAKTHRHLQKLDDLQQKVSSDARQRFHNEFGGRTLSSPLLSIFKYWRNRSMMCILTCTGAWSASLALFGVNGIITSISAGGIIIALLATAYSHARINQLQKANGR